MVKDNLADLVAGEMNDILQSEELRRVFSKPMPIKTASKKEKEDEKDEEKDKDKKDKDEDKKDKDEKKDEKKSKAEQLTLAVQGLAKISEVLDNLGLSKSALVTLRALEVVANEGCPSEDDSYSKDEDMSYVKDKKDDEKEDKDDDKKEDKDDKEEDKDDDKKEDKDDNDASDMNNGGIDIPDSVIDKALERPMPGHGTKAPINEPPKAEPKPARPSDYKPSWERETFDLGEADDSEGTKNEGLMPAKERGKALNRPVPGHGTKAPGNEAPPAESKPQRPSGYKHPWERETFDLSEADEGVNIPDSAVDKALERPMPGHGTKAPINEPPKAEPKPQRPSGYKHPWERETFDLGEAHDEKDMEELEEGSEELRDLLSELGIDLKD